MRRRLAAGDPTATAAAAAAAAVAPLPLEHPPPDQAWPPQPYASPPRRPWRKVLYERQPHGDAYTAESFLEELVVNATVPHRDYATVAWSTLVVDQQLASVAIVGSASFQLYRGGITPRQLLLADVLLMALGSLLYLLSLAWMAATGRLLGPGSAAAQAAGSLPATPAASPAKAPMVGTQAAAARARAAAAAGAAAAGAGPAASAAAPPPSPSPTKLHASAGSVGTSSAAAGPLDWRQLADGASSLAALAAATGLLSPLLGTLTENVSSDSIIACACLLLLAHLYLHDYHFTAGLTAHLSGSLALGCAVCGSVLIASRLRSPLAVYAQLLLSLELYILGPYCRRQVAAASSAAHAVLTAAMAVAAGMLLVRHSPLLTSAFACALAFITLVCPWWLVRIHKFKAAINGPWDEAVPRLSRRVRAQLARPL